LGKKKKGVKLAKTLVERGERLRGTGERGDGGPQRLMEEACRRTGGKERKRSGPGISKERG